MKFIDEVKTCFLNYPMLFKNKLFIYDQLFCALGNDYDWIDGELVSDEGDVDSDGNKFLSINATMEQFHERHDGKWNVRTQSRINDIANHFDELVTKPITDLVDTLHKGTTTSFYNLSSDSKLVTFPDNIKPDWLNAIIELCEFIIKNDVAENNIKHAKQSLTRALKIKETFTNAAQRVQELVDMFTDAIKKTKVKYAGDSKYLKHSIEQAQKTIDKLIIDRDYLLGE